MSAVDQQGSPSRWIMQVVALYDYQPEELDELAFERGEMLHVLRLQDDGWWFGYRVEDPSARGLFPSNYVKQEQPSSVTGYDQDRSGGTRPRYDHQVDSNGGDDVEEQEEAANEDWQYLDRVPRGKLATVRQLRKNAASVEHERDVHGSERERQSQSTREYADGVEDPPDDNEEDDDEYQSGECRDRRGGIADRAQRRQRQSFRFRPLTNSSIDEETSDHDDDEDAVQEPVQAQKQTHRASEYYEDDDGQQQGHYEAASYHRDVWRDQDEQDEDNDGGMKSGSFAVSADRKRQMSAVILEYQHRKEEAAAATVIIRGFRHHRALQQQSLRQQQLHRRQELNRQRWASQIIAEALRRRVQRRRRLEHAQVLLRATLVIRKYVLRRRQQRRKILEAAAIRVQRAFKQRQAYCRWKARVEMQQEALRAMRRKQRETKLQQQQQQQPHQQQQQWKAKPTREPVRPSLLEKDDSFVLLTKAPSITSLSPSHSPSTSPTREKPRKTVMKKEAVDLINGLVRQQLDEMFRDRDSKVEELQRMVAMLQDVVQKQTVMLTASNNQLLKFRRERDEAAAARKQETQLPSIYAPSPTPKQLLRQPSTLISLSAKSPEMKQSMLPKLAPAKPPPSGISTRAAPPTGLRPPRPVEFPTNLPVLVSGRSDVSPRLKER